VRARLALSVIVLAWLSMAPCRADPRADLDYLTGCIKLLPPKQKAGLDQLTILCPELPQTLQDAGVADRLHDHWQTRLSGAGLRQIRALLEHYQAEPLSAAPNTNAVNAIAKALRAQQAPRGWWQRLGEWLRQLLQRRNSEGTPLLERLINALRGVTSERTQRVILYSSLALVLLLVGLVVWRELKAAGIGRRAAQRPARAGDPIPSAETAQSLGLAGLDQVPLTERPALLLRLLVEALRRRGQLAGERTLTHRELIQRAGLSDVGQRQRFAQVSLRAEQQLYGGSAAVATDQVELEQAVSAGRELYSQLAATQSPAS
jgi:hypothetical protein